MSALIICGGGRQVAGCPCWSLERILILLTVKKQVPWFVQCAKEMRHILFHIWSPIIPRTRCCQSMLKEVNGNLCCVSIYCLTTPVDRNTSIWDFRMIITWIALNQTLTWRIWALKLLTWTSPLFMSLSSSILEIECISSTSARDKTGTAASFLDSLKIYSL